ncbi:hypothetical protein MPSEU_000822600 [Mayamaea pseudoterrestris]|nr:hypothetical protein MPSEU_000822600 [Mayamaea pseudoterrestris]
MAIGKSHRYASAVKKKAFNQLRCPTHFDICIKLYQARTKDRSSDCNHSSLIYLVHDADIGVAIESLSTLQRIKVTPNDEWNGTSFNKLGEAVKLASSLVESASMIHRKRVVIRSLTLPELFVNVAKLHQCVPISVLWQRLLNTRADSTHSFTRWLAPPTRTRMMYTHTH